MNGFSLLKRPRREDLKAITLLIGFLLLWEPLAEASVRLHPRDVQQSADVVSASQSGVRVPLEPGIRIEREIAEGEAHSYSLTLAAGQFLHVVVEQRGIDVTVELYEPGGKILTLVDSLNGARGDESFALGVVASGVYLLKVRPTLQQVPPGRYELRINTPRRQRRTAKRISRKNSALPPSLYVTNALFKARGQL